MFKSLRKVTHSLIDFNVVFWFPYEISYFSHSSPYKLLYNVWGTCAQPLSVKVTLIIALSIPTAYDFRVLRASTWARARSKLKRFPWNWAQMRDKCSFSLKPARSTPKLFQVLAENSLIKNNKEVLYWVCFGQGEDFKPTTEQSEKGQCSQSQAIRNGLSEAILVLLMWIKAALEIKVCVF